MRVAFPDELERIAELICDDPSRESIALAGSRPAARALGRALFEADLAQHPGQEFLVAARDAASFATDRAVGVLLARPAQRMARARVDPALALWLRHLCPLELPELLRRAALRAELEFPTPADGLHVAELHVDPAERGRGIGSALLARAERAARARGYARISLQTLSSNRARRLYERSGFRVTRSREVPGYEALTGARGRVWMEKAVDPSVH